MNIYRYHATSNRSYVSVSLALGWNSGVPGPIGAVVVNSILITNPTETTPLERIKVLEFLLIPPAFALSVTELGLDRGLTTIDVEAPVGGHKWSLGPVGLLKPAPRGPIVCVPQARV